MLEFIFEQGQAMSGPTRLRRARAVERDGRWRPVRIGQGTDVGAI